MKIDIRYTTPENVLKHWKYFSEGIEAVLEYSKEDVSMDIVYNELLSGQLGFWAGFIDGNYCGFTTTRIQHNADGSKGLWLVYSFLKKGVPKQVVEEGIKLIEEEAKKMNIQYLKFYTIRDKAMLRRLQPLGWEVGYTELRKCLGGKNA